MKLSRIIVPLVLLLLAFAIWETKSEYSLPRKAYSLYLSDIDLDNNIDIIVGHKTAWEDTNKTISILNNYQGGYFNIQDTSITFFGYQENIFATRINGDNYPDIVTFHSDFSSGNPDRYVRIFYNDSGNFSEYLDFSLNSSSTFTSINYGDINGNSLSDIVFIINNDFQWGIIYNDGTGNFSTPEYYDLNFPPVDITCGDLNNDGRADVVVCGSDTEIYFSTETGFQQFVLTTFLSHDVLITDFDNDGDNDVITHTTYSYPNHRVYTFENLGNNQFLEHDYFQFSPFCSYAQIADFNNDTLPDMVFIAHDNSGLHIYQNIGNFQLEFGQFISIESYGAFLNRISCKDLDGNMYNDIVTIRSWGGNLPSNLNIKFNDGQGGFVDNPITKIQNPKSKNHYYLKVFPNPMKDFTYLEFIIESNNPVNILIFDICGNHITTIENNIYSPGQYKLMWSGTDKNGKEVNPGTYLIRLKAGSQISTQRVVKIK